MFLCSFWQMAVDSCVSISGADSLTHRAARHRAANKKNLPSVLFGTLQGKICAASLYGGVAHRRQKPEEMSVAPRYRVAFSENVVGCNLEPGRCQIFRADTSIGEENGRMHQLISLS